MGGIISLTEREQTVLTIALTLENQGFTEAAAYLRGTISALRLVEWNEPTSHIPWADLFRIHRGSASPYVPAVPPVEHKINIRPDQTVA